MRIITMKNFIFLFSLVFSTLVSVTALAQQDSPQEMQQFSEAELAQMLAPIALYPDSLLTHILIASTYPIEIVEAHRWLKKNEQLNSEQAAQSVKDFDWDASVKALVPFERILGRLSEDLSWSQQLGDAFLQDEARLLESIQALRKQAKRAGNLEKMANMEVSYEDQNIVIEPREKEIVYVPYYDTRMIYGDWYWASYPPVYWTPRHSVYVSHHRPFYWHSAIHISFNYFFSAFHWHNRHVVVVNPYRSHHRYYHQRPRRLIAHGGYAKRWKHKPAHRKGVAYRTKRMSKKYHSNRVKPHKNNKQLHLASHKKAKQHAKKNASVKNHTLKNTKANSVQNRNKAKRSAVPKQYSSKHKASIAPKGHAPNKHLHKASSTQNTVKTYKESSGKSHTRQKNTVVKKKHHNASRKQQHRSAPVKNHHSRAVKARHKD